jgi:hypothetical protein
MPDLNFGGGYLQAKILTDQLTNAIAENQQK